MKDTKQRFVKKMVHQVTDRTITIKNPEGKVVAHFPVYFGIGAAIISAPLTLIATAITLAKKHTISFELKKSSAK